LDDDFIDDGELEMIDQDEDMDMFADGDTSKFQSGRESVVKGAINGAKVDEAEGNNNGSEREEEGEANDQSYDPDKER